MNRIIVAIGIIGLAGCANIVVQEGGGGSGGAGGAGPSTVESTVETGTYEASSSSTGAPLTCVFYKACAGNDGSACTQNDHFPLDGVCHMGDCCK